MKHSALRIIRWQELHQLEEEIEQICDARERDAQTRLLEQILEKINAYDAHVMKYRRRQTLQSLLDRGMVFEPVDRKPIVAEWDRQTGHRRTAQQYSGQFRWHLFSFELLPALRGAEARAAFERQKRQELYIFFDCDDAAYRAKNAHLLTTDDIEALWENSSLPLMDLYFFDPANQWTYIQPHEESCGPYFFPADGERATNGAPA